MALSVCGELPRAGLIIPEGLEDDETGCVVFVRDSYIVDIAVIDDTS